jgi:hypothetical protein
MPESQFDQTKAKSLIFQLLNMVLKWFYAPLVMVSFKFKNKNGGCGPLVY